MSLIKILDSSLRLQAILRDVLDCTKYEELNGQNTISFSCVLDEKAQYINDNAIVELDDDYFDIVYYQKKQNEDGTMTVEVEAEHVSYRLNNPEYNKDYFTEIGTPTEVLTAILQDTGFNIGDVEFTDGVTYSAQEAKLRRQILMEFIALLGGEAVFNKFTISILQHRGQIEPQIYTTGKNIRVISKIFDKREKDEHGDPLVAYVCEPLCLPNKSAELGDEVLLIHNEIGVKETLRVVSYAYNPYDPLTCELQIANFVPGLEDQIYRIETNTVSKDKYYHGCRIGPENGFECIRSDKKARAYLNSTNLALQAGDGSGSSWENKLYYDFDPETGLAELFFAGKFTVEAIEAIKANIDIIVSNTFVTNTLYSEYGRIANLTVNELNTSWKKITNYLESSTAPVLYKRDYEQYSLYIVAITDGGSTEQVQDGEGNDLYWVDDTHKGMTTTVNEKPVLTYVYTELTKGVLSFYLDGSDYVFDIELGAGVGNPSYPDRGKAHIRKKTDGLSILYTTPDGEETEIKLDTFVDAKMRRIDSVNINKSLGELTVLMEGETVPETIGYTEDATSMTFSWADGHTATVSIS